MNRDECKAIIKSPLKSDKEALRALMEYTGGPNEAPRSAAETLQLTQELAPLFQFFRPNVDPEVVKRVDREYAEERREQILDRNPDVSIMKIHTTSHFE